MGASGGTVTTIVATRNEQDQINKTKREALIKRGFLKLESPAVDWTEKSHVGAPDFRAAAVIDLVDTMPVVCLVNSREMRNGLQGTLSIKSKPGASPGSTDIEHFDFFVRLGDGKTVKLERFLFEETDSAGRVVATRLQFPVTYGWAITAHRAQSLTMDGIIAACGNTWLFGHIYTMLSRARRHAGILIKDFNAAKARKQVDPAALLWERGHRFRDGGSSSAAGAQPPVGIMMLGAALCGATMRAHLFQTLLQREPAASGLLESCAARLAVAAAGSSEDEEVGAGGGAASAAGAALAAAVMAPHRLRRNSGAGTGAGAVAGAGAGAGSSGAMQASNARGVGSKRGRYALEDDESS